MKVVSIGVCLCKNILVRTFWENDRLKSRVKCPRCLIPKVFTLDLETTNSRHACDCGFIILETFWQDGGVKILVTCPRANCLNTMLFDFDLDKALMHCADDDLMLTQRPSRVQ
jgi:hypothetical protein